MQLFKVFNCHSHLLQVFINTIKYSLQFIVEKIRAYVIMEIKKEIILFKEYSHRHIYCKIY